MADCHHRTWVGIPQRNVAVQVLYESLHYAGP